MFFDGFYYILGRYNVSTRRNVGGRLIMEYVIILALLSILAAIIKGLSR